MTTFNATQIFYITCADLRLLLREWNNKKAHGGGCEREKVVREILAAEKKECARTLASGGQDEEAAGTVSGKSPGTARAKSPKGRIDVVAASKDLGELWRVPPQLRVRLGRTQKMKRPKPPAGALSV